MENDITLEELNKKIDAIHYSIVGCEKLGVEGLVHKTKALSQDLEDIRACQKDMQTTLDMQKSYRKTFMFVFPIAITAIYIIVNFVTSDIVNRILDVAY